MNKNYTSIEQLPITLSALDLKSALGLSRAAVYQLMKRKDFPKIKIGRRILVPKSELLIWMSKMCEGVER